MEELKKQAGRVTGEVRKITEVGESVKHIRDSAFARFPLLFVMLSTFGLVATLYGTEKIIDATPLFADNPWAVLLAGVGTLIFTGALYKKLN